MIPLVLLTLLIPSLGYNQHFKEQKYEVVFPRKLQSVYKSDTKSTYPDLVYYEFQLDGHLTVIQIEKSVGLFADNYTESHYKEDGTLVTSSPRRQDHCLYQGHIKDDANSSNVVLNACKGLSGIIQTGKKTFFIEPLRMTDTEAHAVYEAADILNHTCGVSNVSVPPNPPFFNATSATKDEVLHLWNSKKYVELFIVADHSMVVKYEKNLNTVKQRIFDIMNYMNKVYKNLKIYVALIGLEIWEASDPFEVVPEKDTLIKRFTDWRNTNLLPRKHHDNAQLITDVDIEGKVIGYAYVGSMCSSTSTGIIQNSFEIAAGVGATLAHEMGHNLGMAHDKDNCKCNAKYCIMSPIIRKDRPYLFSDCSVNYLKSFIYERYPDCLLNVPVLKEILSPPVCGNKFVESGEQCDCGEPQECKDKCCDPNTCKIRPGYDCNEGPCCHNCKFKPGGVVCRPPKDECDIADLCDGNSTTCAKDSFRMNGHPCKNGKGACYIGKCPILSDQCASVWGEKATVADDSCYDLNTKGIHMGHCKAQGETFTPCAIKDKKCGLLYCSGGAKFPRVTKKVFEEGKCKTAVFEDGMVHEGTKCGDKEVCANRICSDIATTYKTATCVCQANAVCDHELKCQCKPGWAPPSCTIHSAASQIILEVFSLWWWPFVLWMLALDI